MDRADVVSIESAKKTKIQLEPVERLELHNLLLQIQNTENALGRYRAEMALAEQENSKARKAYEEKFRQMAAKYGFEVTSKTTSINFETGELTT